MDYKLLIIVYLMICIFPVVPSPYKTRSKKGSAPTYDQKQTGDYNIQVHLKDFEVVALISDGILGDFGDYDYNYDYSDITMKPTSTKKPFTFVTQSTSSVINEQSTSSTTTNPATVKTTEVPQTSTPEVKTTESTTATSSNDVTSSTQPSVPRLETSAEPNTSDENKAKQSSTTSEVPVKQDKFSFINKEHTISEEVMPLTVHRKCANGFTRDKQGRCRRVRRPTPPFSFGISRLATLAQKLRSTNESHSNDDFKV